MTAQIHHAMGPFSFRVAEDQVDVPEMRRRLRRSTGLFLTADANALRQLLPAGISPVLSRPGRAWVLVGAWDGEIALGDLPPIRYGEAYISAGVSHGDRMLPPGVALPGLLQKTNEPAFGSGTFDLLNLVTNRFVRDYYAVIGYRPVVAGLHWEERGNLDRVTCSIDGEPVLDMAMRTEGRPRPSADVFLEYGLRDGHLVRWVNEYQATEGRMVVRSAAGAVRIGSGPLAEELRSLRLASNGSVLQVDLEATVTLSAPQVVAEDLTAPDLPMGSAAVEEPFVLVSGGREETVDQGLASLPFPADAALSGVPVSEWPPVPPPDKNRVTAGLRDRLVVPKGPLGWLMAWSMPLAHKVFYGPVAGALEVQPDDRVLDVACGGGSFLHGFTSKAASVVGLDLSQVQIRLAERRLRDRIEGGSAELAVGEATALPWEGDTFTAVTCMGSLEWFDDPGAALAEMHRVLQPGGRLVLGLAPFIEPGAPVDRSSQAMGITVWTEDEMRELLAAAGFGEPELTVAGEVVVVRAPA